MPLPRFRLDGLVAVVTGGGSGLGAMGAETFAEAGADVALIGRNAAKLERTAETVRAKGRRALVVPADVGDAKAVEEAARAVANGLGRTDILFNNAGIMSPKPLLETTPEAWAQVLDVNLTGAYLCTRAFVPGMIERRAGRIINMGSILSARGMGNRFAYCATKAGLANMGAALAFDLGPHGITINTIGATVIVTDLNRELVRTQPQLYDAVLKRTPLGRLGQPDDLAGALLFLASDAGRFVTGQTIFVDGGYTAG